MNITADKIAAEWTQGHRQRKNRGAQPHPATDKVRGIFIFLVIATILVIAFNYRAEIQSIASSGLHRAANHVTTDTRLRQNAVNYEKQVNDITK